MIDFIESHVGQTIPETCSDRRTELSNDIQQCESAVVRMLSLLADDYNGVEYGSTGVDDYFSTTGRSGGNRTSRSESMESAYALYSGVWGGNGSSGEKMQTETTSPVQVVRSACNDVPVGHRERSNSQSGRRDGNDQPKESDMISDNILASLADSGMRAGRLKEVGFDAMTLRLGGFTAAQLISAGETIHLYFEHCL